MPPTKRPGEPIEILEEDWFAENVICNPEAAGAVRSLRGMNFGLPSLISSHRDDGSIYGPALNYL